MKIDAALLVHDLNQMPAVARFADDAGFDGIWTFETAHEPFCRCACRRTQLRLSLGTNPRFASRRFHFLGARDFRAAHRSRHEVNHTSAASPSSGKPSWRGHRAAIWMLADQTEIFGELSSLMAVLCRRASSLNASNSRTRKWRFSPGYYMTWARWSFSTATRADLNRSSKNPSRRPR